jgi:hypothetical protein
MRKILARAAFLLLALGHAAACSGESRSSAESRSGSDGAAQVNAGAPITGGVADPAAWVRESYDPSSRGAFEAASRPAAGESAVAPQEAAGYSATPQFSPRLRALFAEDESYAGGDIGRLDFNPFSGASDDDISGARVTSEDVDGAPDRRVVTAKFRNMSAEQTITFFWERIGGLWYIDDIVGRRAGEPHGWTLSLILKYGHASI